MSNYKHYTLDDWIQCINMKLEYFDELNGNEMRDLANFLSNMKQPKIGRWEYVQYDSNPDIGNWHCSECRTIIPHMPVDYKWCPMCGAKMEVEG